MTSLKPGGKFWGKGFLEPFSTATFSLCLNAGSSEVGKGRRRGEKREGKNEEGEMKNKDEKKEGKGEKRGEERGTEKENPGDIQ